VPQNAGDSPRNSDFRGETPYSRANLLRFRWATGHQHAARGPAIHASTSRWLRGRTTCRCGCSRAAIEHRAPIGALVLQRPADDPVAVGERVPQARRGSAVPQLDPRAAASDRAAHDARYSDTGGQVEPDPGVRAGRQQGPGILILPLGDPARPPREEFNVGEKLWPRHPTGTVVQAVDLGVGQVEGIRDRADESRLADTAHAGDHHSFGAMLAIEGGEHPSIQRRSYRVGDTSTPGVSGQCGPARQPGLTELARIAAVSGDLTLRPIATSR
jgi:hypothetical protein